MPVFSSRICSILALKFRSTAFFRYFVAQIEKMQQFLLFFLFLFTNICVSGQVNDISVGRPTLQAVDSIEQANNGKVTSYKGISTGKLEIVLLTAIQIV